MSHFLREFISVPGGTLFFILTALLIILQLVVLGIALFAENRSFARRWAAGLALAAPATLLLCILAGVQLARAMGLSGTIWGDPSQKVMLLARAVAGDIQLQLVGGFALALSGLLAAAACGLSLRPGSDEAQAPSPSFAGLGLMLGLASLVFGAGLFWRALGFHNVFSALAAVAPESKMQLLARGLEELPGLLIPALLAAGLVIIGAVWRIRSAAPAGKAALAAGLLCLGLGGLFFLGTRPHAADACAGSQQFLKQATGEGYRPTVSGDQGLIFEQGEPLKNGPELSVSGRDVLLDQGRLADLRTDEPEMIKAKLCRELQQLALRDQRLGMEAKRQLLFMPEASMPGQSLGRILSTLSDCGQSRFVLVGWKTEIIPSAVFGALPVNQSLGLHLELVQEEGAAARWPKDTETAAEWFERVKGDAKAARLRLGLPQVDPPSVAPESESGQD